MHDHHTDRRRTTPVPRSERERLLRIVHELGEERVQAESGLSRHCLARALGGLGIYGVSHAAVRAFLERSTAV